MADGSWSLADAKAKLSEVVDRAMREGPQRITRHGRPAVVHGLTVVTRNVKDFRGWDGPVLNPWAEGLPK